MNQIIKFALVLGVICLIATLVLAVVYEVTKPKIEAQRRAEEEAALKMVMPDADNFPGNIAGGLNIISRIFSATIPVTLPSNIISKM